VDLAVSWARYAAARLSTRGLPHHYDAAGKTVAELERTRRELAARHTAHLNGCRARYCLPGRAPPTP
jgi:alkylhydroperoxidase family enzyme